MHNQLSARFLIGVTLLGILVRLLLMPFGMSVDSRFTGDIALLVQHVQQWDSAGRANHNFFYPPLIYHTLSRLWFVIRPFTRSLDKPILGREGQFNWIASPFVFRNLFMLKLWYLLPDLASAFVLWKMLRVQPARARLTLLGWVFNPLVLYTAYFHGQFDLIPVFFVWLSLFTAQKKQPIQAAFWMGIGACYKNFAFFFLLPLVLILVQTKVDRFKLLLVGALPYALFFIPVMHSYARMGSFFSISSFSAGYDLGFSARIYIFFAFYAALLWYLHSRKACTFGDLWQACFVILLVYYQLSRFSLHYWTWIVPFAILYWIEQPVRAMPFYIIIMVSLPVLNTPVSLARYLAPVSPRFFLHLPSLLEMLNPHLPALFLVNVVRSLLAGTCFYLAWKLVCDMPASRSYREKNGTQIFTDEHR